jgi:hypothetical protein
MVSIRGAYINPDVVMLAPFTIMISRERRRRAQ